MSHRDDPSTTGLSSPFDPRALVGFSPRSVIVPCLTILCHPSLERIGERVLLAEIAAGRAASVARRFPDFQHPGRGTLARPLAHKNLSRGPLRFQPLGHGALRLDRAECRTAVSVDGVVLERALEISAEALERGVVIVLADRVVLLLHNLDTGGDLDFEPGHAGRADGGVADMSDGVADMSDDVADTLDDVADTLDDVADMGGDVADMGLVGKSQALGRLRQGIRNVADLDIPVLLRGETGTGKELVASAIHRASRRWRHEFVAVNMGAMTPSLATAELFGANKGAFTGAARAQDGYFRRAHQGTLFLDEIGETPVDIQVALLRVLETGEVHPLGSQRPHLVDVRVIAATDADLDSLVEDGRFRAPLVHRLAGFEIWLPPLRQRRDDIGRLLMYFLRLELDRLGQRARLEDSAARPLLPASVVAQLARYDWPGNVRELRNVVAQLVVANRHHDQLALSPALARRLASEDEAPQVAPPRASVRVTRTEPDTPGEPVASKVRRMPDEVTEEELLDALAAHRYELVATARALNLSRTSLYARIDASPSARTASDLRDDEIRACHERVDGDVESMVDALGVSRSALMRRLKKLF